MNQAYMLTTYFFKIHCNIILSYHPSSPK